MKKKLIYSTFLFLVLIGCKVDDDTDSTIVSAGTFKIDEVSFPLSQGFFTSPILDSPALYYKTIILTDNGFNSSNNTTLTGRGNAVAFEIYTTANDNNLVGTYTITGGRATAGQATANYFVNYDIDRDTVEDEEEIQSGTLTISLNNAPGTYTVTMANGRVDITGQAFQVYYRGTIKILRE